MKCIIYNPKITIITHYCNWQEKAAPVSADKTIYIYELNNSLFFFPTI